MNIHLHRKTNNLQRCLEIAEWILIFQVYEAAKQGSSNFPLTALFFDLRQYDKQE